MRKNLALTILHRAFGAGIFVIAAGFIGFLAYMYIAYGRMLTGDVPIELSPDLLANLQTQRFESAVGRLEKRASLPDIPDDLPDPYDGAVRPQ